MNSEQLAWLIRRHGVEMTHVSQGSHLGSILSVADIIAVLYNDIVDINPFNEHLILRDKVILSKGHAGASIYAALAELEFFPVDELKTHCANGSRLSGHVSHMNLPGVDLSTGSLGHGLSVGAGLAYGFKKSNEPHSVYVILGDGECDEGSVWEAALVASHLKLNNLVAIIDHNKMQSLDFCEYTISLNPFTDKWKAFGWNVVEVNGHDHNDIRNALSKEKLPEASPTVVIAHTTKGKGISFMENNIVWHYRYPHAGEEYEMALKELYQDMPEGTICRYRQGMVEE